MKLWRVGIVGGIVGLALSGCDDPGPLTPVSPPGAIIQRTDPDPDASQAQGEMPAPARGSEALPATSPKFPPAAPPAKGETKTTKGGVKYETLKEGTGPELKSGQSARLHYVGTLEKGGIFDTTRNTNEPRKFRIGVDPLIEGWAEAIPGMKVGEVRKLIIPPSMGYGEKGKSSIPPNATLIFEVELVDILPDQ